MTEYDCSYSTRIFLALNNLQRLVCHYIEKPKETSGVYCSKYLLSFLFGIRSRKNKPTNKDQFYLFFFFYFLSLSRTSFTYTFFFKSSHSWIILTYLRTYAHRHACTHTDTYTNTYTYTQNKYNYRWDCLCCTKFYVSKSISIRNNIEQIESQNQDDLPS